MRHATPCQALPYPMRRTSSGCNRIDEIRGSRDDPWRVSKPKVNWPEWWNWELDCSNPHLAKRMIDRMFNEAELRAMIENGVSFRPDRTIGRFVIETNHAKIPWQVVVEPQANSKTLVVVTAFPVE
jgi:hypothetical protein